MHTPNTPYFDNADPLSDAQKEERAQLATNIGFLIFVISTVVGFVGILIGPAIAGGAIILERLAAQNASPAAYNTFAALGIISLAVVGLGGPALAIWTGRKARRDYKKLRALCGDGWPTSPWRKLMWSSWLAIHFCMLGILASGFVALALGLPNGNIFPAIGLFGTAGVGLCLVIILFALWRIEKPLERDLLHWATPTTLELIRSLWWTPLWLEGLQWLSYLLGWEARKSTESLINRLVMSGIVCAIALCGLGLAQYRLRRLRASGKVFQPSPKKQPEPTRDLNRTDDIWDAATLARMHALSPAEAEKEANSNLTSATGCAVTVWLALGLIALTLAGCAVLGLKAFQANWDTAVNIAKTVGLIVVVGGTVKKPATQLFSLYKELRSRTQQGWRNLWRVRLLSHVTSNLSLVLIFAFAALQLPFAAFAVPALLVAVGIGLDLHGIQTVNHWSTYRLQKQNWKDAWLSPIMCVIAIPVLARFCSLSTYTAESLIDGWGALRHTLLHNPFWGLPDVWLMVIIAIWSPIEVWLYLQQFRRTPGSVTT